MEAKCSGGMMGVGFTKSHPRISWTTLRAAGDVPWSLRPPSTQ